MVEAEKQITVPRSLAIRTWAFLAQDCSPCAHEECQIDGKSIGVDCLVEEWNKAMDAAKQKEKHDGTNT